VFGKGTRNVFGKGIVRNVFGKGQRKGCVRKGTKEGMCSLHDAGGNVQRNVG